MMSNKIDQNPKKYGYARVSSKSQEVNSSLKSQKQELVRNGILSVEVYKYPYSGRPDQNEDYLSEEICRCTIKIRQKILRKTKRVFVYGQLILSIGHGLAPTQAIYQQLRQE